MEFILMLIVIGTILWFYSIKQDNKPITQEELDNAALYTSTHNVSGGSIKEYARLHREEVSKENKKTKKLERDAQLIINLDNVDFNQDLSVDDYDNRKVYSSYNQYLNSLEWQLLRFEVYKRDNNRCRQCSKDLSKMNGNVHHTTYTNVYNEKLEDLVLVCKDCHQLIHNYGEHFFPLKKTFPLLSTQQYIEAVELSNKFID